MGLLQLLVNEWKFDIDKQDTNRCTPLHIAVLYEKEDMVRQLQMLKWKVDCADSEGLTPLYYAVKRNKLSLVEILLQNGAATDIAANDGSTPLIHAVQQGYKDISVILVGKCTPDEIYNRLKTLESQGKTLKVQLQTSEYQLSKYEKKRKKQEKVDRRRSSDDLYRIQQEMVALRSQVVKLGNEICAERHSIGFSLQGLSSASDLAPVVNLLANKVPLPWQEVCSKLGTTLKRLQDIEREGCKYCYTMALVDLKELNKFTLAGVIEVLKSLGYDDIAMSLHNDSQRVASSDSVEPSVSSRSSVEPSVSSRSSFETLTSLSSCGRNSTFLNEGANAVLEDEPWFGAINEETVTSSTSHN